MLRNLYNTLVMGNQKAIVAFVLSFLGGLGLQVGGVNLMDASVTEIVTSLLMSVLSGVGVWLKANNPVQE